MPSNTMTGPDESGHFGPFGGRFVPETLMGPLQELEEAYKSAVKDPEFNAQLDALLKNYAGRPTPLTRADRLAAHIGKGVYTQTGGPDPHGSSQDQQRDRPDTPGQAYGEDPDNRRDRRRAAWRCHCDGRGAVRYGMRDLHGNRGHAQAGSERLPDAPVGSRSQGVDAGSCTLKDAINEAMRDWVTNVSSTHYLLGSVLGAHPYPCLVRDFQKVIGREARAQVMQAEGRLPDLLIACVGGGSNAIGLFYEFLNEPNIRMIGVEGGGRGMSLGDHAARFSGGRKGILQGTLSYVLQDEHGQIAGTHSISAGLDYPAVGPEHSLLHDSGRVRYTSIQDDLALDAFQTLSRKEGIIPALESAHAIAELIRIAPELDNDSIVIVNLSGRGDKDVNQIAELLQNRS